MFGPARQRRLDISSIERLFGREGVEAAALHVSDLVDQHVALRTQFAGVAGFAQDTRRRIAAAVAELGEGNLDQREPVEEGNERACVLVGFEPHRGRVRLREKGVEGDRGFLTLGMDMLNHRSPP